MEHLDDFGSHLPSWQLGPEAEPATNNQLVALDSLIMSMTGTQRAQVFRRYGYMADDDSIVYFGSMHSDAIPPEESEVSVGVYVSEDDDEDGPILHLPYNGSNELIDDEVIVAVGQRERAVSCIDEVVSTVPLSTKEFFVLQQARASAMGAKMTGGSGYQPAMNRATSYETAGLLRGLVDANATSQQTIYYYEYGASDMYKTPTEMAASFAITRYEGDDGLDVMCARPYIELRVIDPATGVVRMYEVDSYGGGSLGPDDVMRTASGYKFGARMLPMTDGDPIPADDAGYVMRAPTSPFVCGLLKDLSKIAFCN